MGGAAALWRACLVAPTDGIATATNVACYNCIAIIIIITYASSRNGTIITHNLKYHPPYIYIYTTMHPTAPIPHAMNITYA